MPRYVWAEEMQLLFRSSLQRKLSIGIAGVNLHIRIDCPEVLFREILERYRLYTSDHTARKQVRFYIRCTRMRYPHGKEVEPTLRFSGSKAIVRRTDFRLIVDTKSMRVTGTINSTLHSFDMILRIALTLLMRKLGIVLVHSAAFRTFLVPGYSGDGKTTLSRKLGEEHFYSDEINILSFDRGIRIHSTPFWGEFRPPQPPASGKLRALLFLEKGGKVTLTKVSRADALFKLMQCIVYYFDICKQDEFLSKCASKVAQLPAYSLKYSAEHSSVDEIWSALDSITLMKSRAKST